MTERIQELEILRDKIDVSNREIVRLMGERFRLTREVGRLKRDYDLPAYDPQREQEMFAQLQVWAEDEGIDPRVVVDVFETIVGKVRANHDELRVAKHG